MVEYNYNLLLCLIDLYCEKNPLFLVYHVCFGCTNPTMYCDVMLFAGITEERRPCLNVGFKLGSCQSYVVCQYVCPPSTLHLAHAKYNSMRQTVSIATQPICWLPFADYFLVFSLYAHLKQNIHCIDQQLPNLSAKQ